MSLTVSTLKSRYQNLLAPGDDARFLRLLNEAEERLQETAKWAWTKTEVDLTVDSGCVYLDPTVHASLLGVRVDDSGRVIRPRDNEFAPHTGYKTVGGELGDGHLVDCGIVSTLTPGDAASVTVGTDADNNITFTSVAPGTAGNDITAEIAAVDFHSTVIAVTVSDLAITVTPSPVSAGVAGFLTSDGSTPVVFPDMPLTGINIGENAFESGTYGPGTEYFSVAYLNYTLGWGVYYSNNGADTAEWRSGSHPVDEVPDPTDPLLTWTPVGTATGSPVLTFNPSTAQQVIDAVNAAATIVTAAASGTVTGAVAAVAATSLTGGTDTTLRRRKYKIADTTVDGDTVEGLVLLAHTELSDDADIPLCPSSRALKLAMYACNYEEGSDEDRAKVNWGDAYAALSEDEATKRGGVRASMPMQPFGDGVSSIGAIM